MITATATATELQNNFGRLLQEYRSTVCVDAERCHCVLSDRFSYWNFEGRL